MVIFIKRKKKENERKNRKGNDQGLYKHGETNILIYQNNITKETHQWVWSESVSQHHSFSVSIEFIIILLQGCWPFRPHSPTLYRNRTPETCQNIHHIFLLQYRYLFFQFSIIYFVLVDYESLF